MESSHSSFEQQIVERNVFEKLVFYVLSTNQVYDQYIEPYFKRFEETFKDEEYKAMVSYIRTYMEDIRNLLETTNSLYSDLISKLNRMFDEEAEKSHTNASKEIARKVE
jgi:hypothetical protein